jgi:hypothetical protein
MPRLSLAFFSAAVVYGVIGMIWGGFMGAHEDFVTAPAHAHLNLLGWVTMGLMGTFYALAGPRAPIRLGWINFTLSNLGVIVGIPSLAVMLSGDKAATPIMEAGMGVVLIGMLTFAAAVFSLWAKPKLA